jgi:prolyl oligopeptidase
MKYPRILLPLLTPFLLHAQDLKIVPKSSAVDTMFGLAVADPYRWLESLNSEATQAWLKQQRVITRKAKSTFDNAYIGIYDQILRDGGMQYKNWIKEGRTYFRFKQIINAAGTNRYSSTLGLYRNDSIDGDVLVFDPNIYSNDITSIEGFAISNDGEHLTVSLSREGSDWQEIRVVNLANNRYSNFPLPSKELWGLE